MTKESNDRASDVFLDSLISEGIWEEREQWIQLRVVMSMHKKRGRLPPERHGRVKNRRTVTLVVPQGARSWSYENRNFCGEEVAHERSGSDF